MTAAVSGDLKAVSMVVWWVDWRDEKAYLKVDWTAELLVG